jgi:hypothetical protein
LELGLSISEKKLLNVRDLKIYIYHKVTYITKYEKLEIYFKSEVVGGIFTMKLWVVKIESTLAPQKLYSQM